MSVDVSRNTTDNRFELLDGDRLIGTLDYSYEGDVTVLERIEVDEDLTGQGLASRFAESVLQQMRGNEESVIAHCPFVRHFLVENPQFQDLVPPDHLADLRS